MPLRTAILVIGGALAMLVAAFSLQDVTALADDHDGDPVAAIWGIQSDAADAVEARTSRALADIAAATSESAVKALRDAAVAEIAGIEYLADGAMWWVASEAGWTAAVTEAYVNATGQLDTHVADRTNVVVAAADARMTEILVADILDEMDQQLATGVSKLALIESDFEEELADTTDPAVAVAERDDAIGDVSDRVDITLDRLGDQLARLPGNPEVQAAHAAAEATMLAEADAATATINAAYDAWLGAQGSGSTTTTVPPATTTTVSPATTSTTSTVPAPTTPPSTTTTVAPPAPPPPSTTVPSSTTTTTTSTTTATSATTTTSTTVPSTTTTVPPPPTTTSTTSTTVVAAQLPPTRPPMLDTAFMPDLPAPAVLSASTAQDVRSSSASNGDMAAVGFVRRVVDSQLPAGVSTVAAGPLVVLGLIIDAIRAAGALMMVPWLLLGIYVAGLLRGWRGFTTPGG
jgi:hypothetical protein